MKMTSLSAATFFCLILGFTAKADYIIKQSVDTGTGTPIETVSYLKGNKVRIDTGNNLSIIRDTTSGDMSILSPSTKTVRKLSGTELNTLQEKMKKAVGSTKPDLKPTGKHETINGYPCDEFTYTLLGTPVHIFIDKDFPNYQKVLQAMKEVNQSTAQAGTNPLPVDQFPGMPIKTTIEIMGHKITTTLVAADEKPVEDSQFIIPADYTERKLPGMIQPAPAAPEGK